MARFLCVLALATAIASPVWAQSGLDRAGPVPEAVPDWRSVSDTSTGKAWFDARTVLIDGGLRSARFRILYADGRTDEVWMQFDCAGGRMRIMEIDRSGPLPVRKPVTDWQGFQDGAIPQGRTVGSLSREKLCAWVR